jgi:hypothetical protein
MQRFTNHGQRLAELRRSNASGPHKDPRPRQLDRQIERETIEEIQAINYAEDEVAYGQRDWLNP